MVSAFKLPLTKDEFKNAMKLGHGRALLHVREFGLDEYRSEFIKACVSNQVFDTQCEDSRTKWLCEFFEGSPVWLVEPLIRAYSTVNDQRDRSQIAELLGLLARRGSHEAQNALNRFRSPSTPDLPPIVDNSEKRPHVHREKPRRASAEEFIEAARLGQVSIGYCRSWSKSASTEELAILAKAVQDEDSPETLEGLLRCFMDTGLPEYWPGLLDLCEHEVHDVRWITYWVLRYHRHPDVRALAIRRLEENRIVEGEFKLFECNFEKGDAKRILGGVRRFPDVEKYIFHSAMEDVLDVAIANSTRETLSLLVEGYEKTPCALCRRKAIEEMCKRRELPRWIAEECRQGCDFYLREKLDVREAFP